MGIESLLSQLEWLFEVDLLFFLGNLFKEKFNDLNFKRLISIDRLIIVFLLDCEFNISVVLLNSEFFHLVLLVRNFFEFEWNLVQGIIIELGVLHAIDDTIHLLDVMGSRFGLLILIYYRLELLRLL